MTEIIITAKHDAQEYKLVVTPADRAGINSACEVLRMQLLKSVLGMSSIEDFRESAVEQGASPEEIAQIDAAIAKRTAQANG